jgi:hypothetical protein
LNGHLYHLGIYRPQTSDVTGLHYSGTFIGLDTLSTDFRLGNKFTNKSKQQNLIFEVFTAVENQVKAFWVVAM